MRKINCLLIVIGYCTLSFSQSGNFENTFSSLGTAAAESFRWWDLPAAGLMISSAYFPLKLDDKINIGTFSFDEEFREAFRVPGSHSLGSMEPRRYPETVFFGRLALTTAAGMLFGMDTKESYKHNFVFMKAVMYNFVITELIKNVTDRNRPDQSDNRSFFSGHTSTTFAASSFLFCEISDKLDESYSDSFTRTFLKTTSFAALYGWAGYVGYSRMRDDRHYFSDVLIGAAIGTFIGNYFYNLYFEEGPGFLEYFSLGYNNNCPTVSFNLSW